MKKNLPIIFCTFLLFSCIQDDLGKPVTPVVASTEIASSDFVKGSEDIPLVSDLELIDNNNVDFDSESGSFTSVEYKSQMDLEAVQGFYLKTLPQMGWQLLKNDQAISKFIRDNEKLEIHFIYGSEGDDDIVKFMISSGVKR